MLASYHNHTAWSDGKASPAALVESAVAQGLGEVGISDHLVLPGDGSTRPWSMAPERVAAYVQEVAALQGRGDIAVRTGVELDWFDDSEGMIAEVVYAHAFDVVIGAVHEVDGFVVDGAPPSWARLSPEAREEVHRRYWLATARMASSGILDVAAHLDLTKKCGFPAMSDRSREINAALDAIAEGGLVVELNTAGWFKPCRDAYPSLDILRGCFRRDIPVTLSADAHDPAHLLRAFDRGAARLAEAGYDKVVRFGAVRERRFESLDDAVPGNG